MNPRGGPDSDNYQANRVFVGGISWKADEQSLANFFSTFGKVVECKIIMDKVTGKSKGYGFVTFQDLESAEAVKRSNNLYFLGKMMNVGDAVRKNEPSKSQHHQQSSHQQQQSQNQSGGYSQQPYLSQQQGGYGYAPYFNQGYQQGFSPNYPQGFVQQGQQQFYSPGPFYPPNFYSPQFQQPEFTQGWQPIPGYTQQQGQQQFRVAPTSPNGTPVGLGLSGVGGSPTSLNLPGGSPQLGAPVSQQQQHLLQQQVGAQIQQQLQQLQQQMGAAAAGAGQAAPFTGQPQQQPLALPQIQAQQSQPSPAGPYQPPMHNLQATIQQQLQGLKDPGVQ